MDEVSVHVNELVVAGPDDLDRVIAARLRAASGQLDPRLADEISSAVARSLYPALSVSGGCHEGDGHSAAQGRHIREGPGRHEPSA